MVLETSEILSHKTNDIIVVRLSGHLTNVNLIYNTDEIWIT